jgi:hypothetical protein
MRQFSSLLWPLSSNYEYLYLLLVEVCFWMLLPLGYHDPFPSALSLFLVSYEMVSVLPLYTLSKLLIGKSHAPSYISLTGIVLCLHSTISGLQRRCKAASSSRRTLHKVASHKGTNPPLWFSRWEGRPTYSIDKKNQTLDNVLGMWRSAIKLPGS